VLVVADAELDISQAAPVVVRVIRADDPAIELGAFKVGLDAQQLGVPLPGRGQVGPQ